MGVYDFYITPDEYEIANENGISYKLLNMRIRDLGWDKVKAITTIPKKFNSIKEYIDIANSNGICEGTFLTRIRKLGWSKERASTEPIVNQGNLLRKLNENNRIYSKEIIDLANSNGISYDTFQARVKRQGMSLIDAATIPIRTKSEVGKMGNEAFKKIYGCQFSSYNR